MSVHADGKPSGARTTVQYNDAGAFAGAASLTYDKVNDTTIFQGQTNHTPQLSAERLVNGELVANMDGWSGVGWSWVFVGSFGAIEHDPLETAILQTDATTSNTSQAILVSFSTTNWTQGSLGVCMAAAGVSITAAPEAIIFRTPETANYTCVVYSDGPDYRLTFDPQPGGTGAIFDGQISALTAKEILFSDPIVTSILSDAAPGGLRIHLVDENNLAYGTGASRGIGPTARDNLAIGVFAMEFAWLATLNTAIGAYALQFASRADRNIAIGRNAMAYAQIAHRNVAIGADSLSFSTFGEDNVAIGHRALENLATGIENVVIASFGGSSLLNGTGNMFIGSVSIAPVTSDYRFLLGHYIANDPLFDGDFQAQTLTVNADVTVRDDLDFSTDANGPILIDRTTATRYRLFVDSGVLGIEVV